MNPASILKFRLLLKRLMIRIDAAVENNFGAFPSYQWADDLMDKFNDLWHIVKEHDPVWLEQFEHFTYINQTKKAPTFIL